MNSMRSEVIGQRGSSENCVVSKFTRPNMAQEILEYLGSRIRSYNSRQFSQSTCERRGYIFCSNSSISSQNSGRFSCLGRVSLVIVLIYLLYADNLSQFSDSYVEIQCSACISYLSRTQVLQLSLFISCKGYFLPFFDIAEKLILSLLKCLLTKAALTFLSALVLLNPYMFNCRTNEAYLPCLKQWGSTPSSRACTQTMHSIWPLLSQRIICMYWSESMIS